MASLGIHLPNRHLEAGELERILKLDFAHYLIYLYDLGDSEQDYWRAVAAEIKRQQPGAKIHVRVEQRGNYDLPGAEAQVVMMLMWRFGHLVNTWRIRNEPQIESPGVTPAQWQQYLTVFGKYVRTAMPNAPIYAAAVSPGIDYLPWLDATVAGAKAGNYAGIDCHAYGSPDEVRDVVAALRTRWSGPIQITEHNFGAGRDYSLSWYASGLPSVLRTAGEYGAESLILFIWQWNNPDPGLQTTVDIRGTVVEEFIRTWRRQAEVVAVNELYQYPNWAIARIDNKESPADLGAFTAHLKAIGKDWRRPEVYGWPLSGDRAVATADRINAAVEHLDTARELLRPKA